MYPPTYTVIYTYVVTLVNTCSCHTVLMHGFIQQITVHNDASWCNSCATITCSSSKGFAQSVVYNIHSALHTQVFFCSSTHTRDMHVVYRNTESITHMYSIGFYSQWQTFLSAPRCQQRGTRLPEWLHHTSQRGHKSLWSRQPYCHVSTTLFSNTHNIHTSLQKLDRINWREYVST